MMAALANSVDIHGCVFHAANIYRYFISPIVFAKMAGKKPG
jgi:hypothetical protein